MRERHVALVMLAVGTVLVARPAVAVAQQDTTAVLVESFDGAWRDRWSEQSLGRQRSMYQVVERNGNAVLRATANRSASAVVRRVRVPTTGVVEVAWRWAIEESLASNESERERGGDDYAARVFVLFGAQELDRSTRALLYVWAAHEPVGATYRSPYVEQVATIVLRSGDDDGTWRLERRDIVADYRRAFGEDPPSISAIALMTDTDDSNGRAAALFDDVTIVRGHRTP